MPICGWVDLSGASLLSLKSVYISNDRVCAGNPLEGARVFVVFADVLLDRFDEVAYGMESSTPDAFARDFGEPAFDLVQPRGTGGGKVNVIARVCAKPPFYFRMLMRTIVVQDQMDMEASIHSRVDLLQET